MAITRKARIPMTEKIRLINECRQSGMTDADWCRVGHKVSGTRKKLYTTHKVSGTRKIL